MRIRTIFCIKIELMIFILQVHVPRAAHTLLWKLNSSRLSPYYPKHSTSWLPRSIRHTHEILETRVNPSRALAGQHKANRTGNGQRDLVGGLPCSPVRCGRNDPEEAWREEPSGGVRGSVMACNIPPGWIAMGRSFESVRIGRIQLPAYFGYVFKSRKVGQTCYGTR